mmetsp:Transcript_11147/g.21269  ORF Transcript_11147/g.21269 Transcript_11147/m.21269 type:complete len:185 (-) Transcript_11147:332-886(-)|eukprot:CAMPEP_0197465314 /NCGR_PEP_ID=MMETSP1175-20131217/64477_1 /TAXON_ID=1003142 /ORGANISM="Triceratium dubium, Strain CCMP147" /LENGTH=184 /DNA_ID=CAMNT_0043001325 /DNA_START=90 /DNA_END=644 /DNA_ORIENTATION=-
MRSLGSFLSLLCLSLLTAQSTASVFLPKSLTARPTDVSVRSMRASADLAAARRRRMNAGKNGSAPLAMAIPGYGVAEQVFVGGFANFLQIYNLVITARILLSWFPQAAGIGALQPVYAITDPYLNLFRGIIPPVFGLDLSPLLAFFVLNVATSTTAAIGCEIPKDIKLKLNEKKARVGRRFSGL